MNAGLMSYNRSPMPASATRFMASPVRTIEVMAERWSSSFRLWGDSVDHCQPFHISWV